MIAAFLAPSASFAPQLRLDARAAAATAMCSTLLFVGSPSCSAKYLQSELEDAFAARQTAVLRLADASYPLIPGALKSELVPTFADGLSNALAATKPELLTNAVASYQDMLLSVPDDQATALKTAAGKGGCSQRITLPPGFSSVQEQVARANDPKAALKPGTAGQLCLPPLEEFERLALAEADAISAMDGAAVKRFQESMAQLQKSVKFKVAAELTGQAREAYRQGGSYMQRDGAKKALDAYLSSSNLERELREKQAAGPPPCFTIGCKVNYEAEIWGANRDVGGRSGMEKVMISPLL
jgi:hypothetical protein